MKERLAEALSEIRDTHIAEAANVRKRHRRAWLGITAAVLILALLWQIPSIPMFVNAKAVSTASGSRVEKRSDSDDPVAFDTWLKAWDQRQSDTAEALTALAPFFADSTRICMSGASENRVWSPVNAYIALSMLAEVTDGGSRQQVLDALGTPDLETLRTQVSAVWETVCQDDGNEISLLANSLWLDEKMNYDQAAMDALSYYHYASVYQADLGSSRAANALQSWLHNNTGGLLNDRAVAAGFPENAVLTLASTVYLQSKWTDEFHAGRNTAGLFHSPGGDASVTYMNKKEYQTNYYWGESFGAVALGLKNGTRMWFFLPDADKSVDDILVSGEYLGYLRPGTISGEDCSKYMKVNLSIPKFDIATSSNLSPMLRQLGITDVFDPEAADFTAITSDSPVCVTGVNQAARVMIDEQGVKAASYIEIPGAGAAAPPEEIIDFILDRPFLFVIATYDGVPLFVGTVNQP